MSGTCLTVAAGENGVASEQPVTAASPRDILPLPQKVLFGAGCMLDYLATGLTMSVLWMPYFNIGLGISPAVLGLLLMGYRAWDAITDIVIGAASDNARTRWGRRRPFILVGAVSTALVYPLLWRPPTELGSTAVLVYLVAAGMLYFTCFTFWSMPYYGMQLELTPDYHERTRITAWITVFGKLATCAGGWSMAIITGKWFQDAVTGKPDIVAGMKTCSWFIALAILLVGVLPALFVPERFSTAEIQGRPKVSLLKSIAESATCRPLWFLIGISFFVVLGNASVATLWQYLNIYYIHDGQLAPASILAGWKTTVVLVTGVAGIPFWTWLGGKYDKKTLLGSMLALTIAGHVSNLWCLRPELPYLQLVPALFESAAIAAVWLFLPSMKADVADFDELTTEARREGSLNAFYSWFIKAALTLAVGLGGYLITFTGFEVHAPHQPAEVLQRMKAIYIVLPVLLWGTTFIFLAFYPLTRTAVASVREALEARRGKI